MIQNDTVLNRGLWGKHPWWINEHSLKKVGLWQLCCGGLDFRVTVLALVRQQWAPIRAFLRQLACLKSFSKTITPAHMFVAGCLNSTLEIDLTLNENFAASQHTKLPKWRSALKKNPFSGKLSFKTLAVSSISVTSDHDLTQYLYLEGTCLHYCILWDYIYSFNCCCIRVWNMRDQGGPLEFRVSNLLKLPSLQL